MKKIRITEKQVAIILKREKDLAKKKVLKINESQYKRLFRNEGIFGGNSDKNTEEPKNKEIDPLEFAQQLIIFVRDIIKRKPRPFSNYWEELGITRAQLIKMLKDNEVLELVMDEGKGKNVIKARKTGFRRAIKTIYKDVVANRDTIGVDEVKTPDTSYMSGISDPRDEPTWDDPIEVPKDKRRFKMIDYFDDANQLALFNDANKQLYAISIEDMEDRDAELNPYSDSDLELGYPVDADAIFRYVNHQYMNAPLESIPTDVDLLWKGYLVRVNQEVKEALLEAYNNNEELYNVLNSAIISDSTGTPSSGSYVGGMSGGSVIKKDTGYSPGESMRGISDVKPEIIADGDMNEGKWSSIMKGVRANPQGPYTIVIIMNGKVVDQVIVKIADAIPAYYEELKRKYPNAKISIENGYGLSVYNEGLAESMDNEEIDETTSMGGSSGINVGNGGDSMEYDVNAFGNSKFMKAGNKLNKESAMPTIRKEGLETGQIYSNGIGRAYVGKPVDPEKGIFQVTIKIPNQPETNANLGPNDLGGWRLFENVKKVLKVTKAQMKIIMEATNKDSTAYPKGGFVELDDCTKLNNNTEAQDGGCSQGAVDNVVKLKKTKDSVVSKG